jgi:glyoxylase-like metal-dependent hydrolase (beta-lactamase superfamily II)
MPTTLSTGRPSGFALPSSAITLLDLGALRADDGWFVRGANAATAGDPSPSSHALRELALISVAIAHPQAGLLLYDVGIPPEPELWDQTPEAVFPTVHRTDAHRLDHALAAAGYQLDDVAGVITSHLHGDHAGGLRHFTSSDVPIWVHHRELEHALFVVATGQDPGSYGAAYLDLGLNWQPVHGDVVELFPGLELHHLPGHSPGLTGLLVERADDVPLFFVNDQFPFADSRGAAGQGWVTRDDHAWHASARHVERVVASRGAELVYGHDPHRLARRAEHAATAAADA